MEAREHRYDSLFKYYAEKERVKFPWQLAKAIAKVESDFDPYAESKKGAKGLCQFMDATWEEWGSGDPFNPEESIKACIKYLKWLYDEWDGVVSPYRLGDFVVASYNWGIGNMKKLYEKSGRSEAKTLLKMPKSVRNYVSGVRTLFNLYRRLGAWAAK